MSVLAHGSPRSLSDFEFAILGAGAMGSILGAHLARAGHSVAMLARGERAAYVERHGLTIKGLAEFTAPVQTLREPMALSSAGVLIVATKTPGTAAALDQLRHARLGTVLSIQNGPIKYDLLAQAFGKERVLGALADTSGELLPDGTVLFTRNVNIMIGELCGGESERTRQLARTIDGSGVRAVVKPEILTLEWSKFCAWVGLTALGVSTRAPTWKYLSDPDGALLVARVVREMGVLARALGMGLSDHAVLPVASICSAGEAEAAGMVVKAGRLVPPGHRISALQDVEAGRPLEVNETLGYAYGQARARGLNLPLLGVFLRLVAAIDRTRLVGSSAPSRGCS